MRRLLNVRPPRIGSKLSAGLAVLLGIATAAAGHTDTAYQYLSPVPGAHFVSPLNNVIIRHGEPIDVATLDPTDFTLMGAASGTHTIQAILSDDGETIVLKPVLPFSYGEHVTVTLAGDVRTHQGTLLPPLSLDFTIAPSTQQHVDWLSMHVDEAVLERLKSESATPFIERLTSTNCEAMPSRYPPFAVPTDHDPEPGVVLMAPYAPPFDHGNLVILDDLGHPLFYRDIGGAGGVVIDFKKQPNGLLTYFETVDKLKFYALDASYTVVDSFATGNGYKTDGHELLIMPNGHALMMSYDPQYVAMDEIVPGGYHNATVIGLVIQELDLNKNVVFQWRSWDHFDILDSKIDLTTRRVDYVHGNAMDLDLDGNILLSSRHLSEITKIDRATGDIIWRMGPHAKNNEFTFVNDPRGFSFSHDIRRLPNGHITLFDNGVGQSPQYTRAAEYQLDEVNKIATLVWEYRTTPDTYSDIMGNVQRLPSGATMIGWGGQTGDIGLLTHNITEIAPDQSTDFEVRFLDGSWNYRAFREDWTPSVFTTDVQSLDFGTVEVGMTATRTLSIHNPSSTALTITCLWSPEPSFTALDEMPIVIPPGGDAAVDVAFTPRASTAFSSRLYVRSVSATELIAVPVAVTGRTPPTCDRALALVDVVWPPNHEMAAVQITGVTDAEGDPVSLAITGITQDEPLDALGDSSTCPDAMIDAQGNPWIRQERQGGGNGRVYEIAFTATDDQGQSCDGTVRVCVPHDLEDPRDASARGLRSNLVGDCIDDGQAFDALGECPGGAHGPSPRPEIGVADLHPLAISGNRAIVELDLPAPGEVVIALYDVAGRRRATIDESYHGAGRHELTWDTSSLSPGVYFYRMRAGGVVISRPVLIVR